MHARLRGRVRIVDRVGHAAACVHLEQDLLRHDTAPVFLGGNGDDLLDLDVAVLGGEREFPGETGPAVIARSESLVISRGATSTLSVETGTPPSGYRFLVTASF